MIFTQQKMHNFFIIVGLCGALYAHNVHAHGAKNSEMKMEQMQRPVRSGAGLTDEIVYAQAAVRFSTVLGDQEQEFLFKRRKIVKPALEKFLGQSLHDYQVPRIAFCFSGGGYRAMLETLGFLSGAEQIGLLDTAMYTSGLSGSTWALMPWAASGQSLHDYKKQLIPKLSATVYAECMRVATREYNDLWAIKRRKDFDKNHFGFVDLYGAVLSSVLLEGLVPNKNMYGLDDIAPTISDARLPLPMATAVMGGAQNNHIWFEFTPFEVGSYKLGFVPAWAFGRVFEDGNAVPVQQDIDPETFSPRPYYGNKQTLGFYMGVWGSAFAANGHSIARELKLNTTWKKDEILDAVAAYKPRLGGLLSKVLHNLIDAHLTDELLEYIKNNNMGAARVPNFTFGKKYNSFLSWAMDRKVPLCDKTSMSVVDGAYDAVDGNRINIGIMPLLRPERALDVIVVCDSSGLRYLQNGLALRAAEMRARSQGFKFPPIDYESLSDKHISVFEDPHDVTVPTVIYMPCITNPNYGKFDPAKEVFTTITNFTYAPFQAQALMGLAQHNVVEAAPVLRNAIKRAVSKKSWLPFWR
jgi:cytosolic phospholipase A2